MPQTNENKINSLDNALQLQSAKCFLFEFGCTYKEAASFLNISSRTIIRWANENRWKEKLREKRKHGFNDLVAYIDSSIRYQCWLQIHNSDVFNQQSQAFQEYKSERIAQLQRIAKVAPDKVNDHLKTK